MSKRLSGFLLTILLIMLMVVVPAYTVSAASGDASDDGISVVITTDKDEYEAGEVVEYTIEITCDKELWFISKGDFKYSNTAGLNSADGGELINSYPKIKNGESYTITGKLIGDEAVFPQVETEEITTVSQDTSGDEASSVNIGVIIAVILGVVLVIVIVLLLIKGKKGPGAAAIILLMLMCAAKPAIVNAADAVVTLRPYVNIVYAGQNVVVRAVFEFDLSQERVVFTQKEKLGGQKTSCHDPSIFKDVDGTYYIFGTHMGLSSSTDLFNWKNLDNSFRASFTDEEKSKIRAWNDDASSGSWYGYLWAPDVVYNETMGKYCMYLSANGDNWKSNIVLLTADQATGPYSYAGTIVYGGFCAEDYAETDAPMVLNQDTMPERYETYGVKNKKWGDAFPNCIDPCVFFDDEGQLWMSYGSWSGGIFMLKLDTETGLRDYTVTYEDNAHSDPYFGKKIAGGKYVSGEGSYIQKIGDYYFLFISYGNLEAKGGYNVRIFRSETPDGNYVDEVGNSAFYDTYIYNYNDAKGVRLFGGYKWRTGTSQVAQGHNSAFVDDDGRAYIIFHTRTTDGSEGHYVKVHQLFVNEDGWLVAAPYLTNGEALSEKGYDSKNVAGKYEVILHKLNIDFKNYDLNKPELITLAEDGTVSGDYTGSWKIVEGTSYIELVLDKVTYKGVILDMYVEGSNITSTVFTVLGEENQLTLWGSRLLER